MFVGGAMALCANKTVVLSVDLKNRSASPGLTPGLQACRCSTTSSSDTWGSCER